MIRLQLSSCLQDNLFYMEIHTDSVRYLWEVLEQGEYSFLFDKLRVLDLGCNVGAFSLWIYPKIDKLWAVDMNQNHLDNFQETIRANNLQNISLYCERVRDLGEFMSGHNIHDVDILKIDVEGDEYEIFSKPFPRIPTIIGEFHRESPAALLLALGYRYIELPNKHFIARQ